MKTLNVIGVIIAATANFLAKYSISILEPFQRTDISMKPLGPVF